MAKEDDDKEKDSEGEEAEGGKKSRKKLIIILSLVIVLVTGIGVGVTWFFFPQVLGMGDQEMAAVAQDTGDGKPKRPRKGTKDGPALEATYFAFDPPFIVNFRDQTHARFLQVEVQVMTTDPLVVDQLKKHMPRIRNDLILLFSSQSYETLSTREGKEKMRDEALFEIRKILKEETGNPGVEALYFTALIMQ